MYVYIMHTHAHAHTHTHTHTHTCTQEYSSLHTQAVQALALCLEDTANMAAIQSSGCLKQLLIHVAESTVPDMKRNAVCPTP